MRVAGHQLVVHAAGHLGQVEPPLLGRQAGVEEDLEQQVAQLLFEVVDRLDLDAVAGLGPGQLVDGVDHLVGLLQEVAGERGVGLLAVPRAVLAQAADEAVEGRHLPGHR